MRNGKETVRLKDAFSMRREPEAQKRLAQAFWHVVLLLCAFLISGSIVYGIVEFLNMPPENITTDVRAPQTFSRSDLTQVLNALGARAAQFETLRTTPGSLKDPS